MKKRTKFLFLRASVVLVFAILAGRVWYIQVVMGSYYQVQADTSKIRILPVQAARGIIYDRNGYQLVYNAPSWNVDVIPHGVPATRAQAIYRTLARLLGGHPSAATIAAKVRAASWQPFAPVVVKQRISSTTAMIIKQLHRTLPGVKADPGTVRQYIDGPQYSLSHLLGYAGIVDPATYKEYRRLYPALQADQTDLSGRGGIELALDPYLHGINGREQVEVDSGERPVRVLNPGSTVPGDSVYLTIDWRLQQQVSADLSAALNKLHLRRGVAIVEDVRNGQILSMVSLPSFNNNLFAGGISQSEYARLLKDPARPLYDLATQGQYPPGSTYKVVTATAALQTGVADAGRIVDDTGKIALPGHTFYGWLAAGLGPVNVVRALAMSSDIYFYTVAGGNPLIDSSMPRIGANRLASYARLLGLGAPSGVELPDESPGFVPSATWYNNLPPVPSDPVRPSPAYTWHIGDTYNMAIGQGYDLATPLQMVNVAATVANGGTLYRPRLVKDIVGQVLPRAGVRPRLGNIQPFVPTVVRRNFIDPTNLSLVQEGMHQSVSNNWSTGTSVLAYDPRIDAAGKTGTAEDSNGTPHAWWIGYAPFNHPRIAVVIMVPNADSEGAYVAVPIGHKIMEDYFGLKPTKRNWLDDVSQQLVGGNGN